jgi:hypothetical protein
MSLSDLYLGQNEDGEDSRKLKRQNQTSKARTAAQLTFQRRRLERSLKKTEEAEGDADQAAKASFQSEFLASSSTKWNPVEDVPDQGLGSADVGNGRRRAVFLYFRSFVIAVCNLFLQSSSPQNLREQEPHIRHVISININDDTNIKLGSGKRGSAEVRSVMNNVQQHVVIKRPLDWDDMPAAWFCVHQPMVALERADTSNLYAEFMSWILCFCGYVGWRFRAWGMPRHIFQSVERQTMCFVGDALKVNDALFQRVTQAVQSQPGDQPKKNLALQIHCAIHQVALTRKTLALGFHGFWSTLVRLGHLFSSHSFRQKFRAAMAKVIQQNFLYLEVASLPPEVEQWNQLKINHLRMYEDTGHMGFGGSANKGRRFSKRLKALTRHMQKDNGDPRSPMFTHWCTGASCCPGGQQEALAFLMTSFLDMFDYMCVPLLYRWKHAMAANNFVMDGFFWHEILPRTLAAMPTLKCHLAQWFI